jgi:DNA-binding response OmpR family regulator
MANVLAFDKDPVQLEVVSFLLEKQGHAVHCTSAPDDAVDLLQTSTVDLIVIEPSLPRHDGTRLCQQMRQLSPQTPLMIVSERGEEDHIVHSLMTAADDYVTKPISPRQFLARVHALLRRSQMSSTSDYQHEDITVGEITLSLTDMRARVNGAEVLLTPREMSLLHTLLLNSPRLLSRTQLMERWGDHFVGLSKAVDVYVQRLRKKLQPHLTGGLYIQAVRGYGYRLAPPKQRPIARAAGAEPGAGERDGLPRMFATT